MSRDTTLLRAPLAGCASAGACSAPLRCNGRTQRVWTSEDALRAAPGPCSVLRAASLFSCRDSLLRFAGTYSSHPCLWFLFSVRYSENYTASAKFCQGKPPAGKTAELLLAKAITNERRQLSVFPQYFFFMSLQFSIHFGIVQTILITRITPI